MNFDPFKLYYSFPKTIEDVDNLTGQEFETFLFHFFKLKDWKPSKTGTNGDRGIDILIDIENNNIKKRIGVQAKRWKGAVGYDEITKMLGGKKHYNLDEVWIIATSQLTKQAEDEALNNDILIITRNNIIEMLKDLENYDVKFIEKPTIQIKNQEKEIIKIINNKKNTNTNANEENKLFIELKNLRFNLAKELKTYPVYVIYNNENIFSLIENMPLSVEELTKIKGFGEKKINTYGEKIIETIINFCKIEYKDQIERLNQLREKITEYNNLDNTEDAFNDTIVLRLIINHPENIEELTTIKDFPPKNIDLFGNYLISQLKY